MGAVKIALTGKLRSGKSVLASYASLFYDFRQFAFGDELKRYYHEMFRVPREPKPRAGYQHFGQLMRQLDDNVWIGAAERSIARYLSGRCDCNPARIIVTDLRQPNEYEWARVNGYTIIRVTAPAEVRLARAQQAGDQFSAEDFEHETELAVDGFAVDYEIVNDGTSEEMTDQFDAIMAEIGVEAIQ